MGHGRHPILGCEKRQITQPLQNLIVVKKRSGFIPVPAKFRTVSSRRGRTSRHPTKTANTLTTHVLGRRSQIATSSALVLAGAVANASKGSALMSTTQTVWVFADSIAKGEWLADPQQGWSFVLQRAAAAQGITVTGYSVGALRCAIPAAPAWRCRGLRASSPSKGRCRTPRSFPRH